MDNHCNSEAIVLKKLELLLDTGCLLMSSNADTARIARNMKRVAAFLGIIEEDMHIYFNFNILMVNVCIDGRLYSKYQRCDKHGINMATITAISKLSWLAIKEDYSLEQYEQALNAIKERKNSYTDWQVAACSGFACGGFCIQFGCDWTAFFYASIAAMLGMRLKTYLNKKGSNTYINITLSAFVATLIAWLFAKFSLSTELMTAMPDMLASILHTDTPWHPLMACTLFIVPGVPIINVVSDMLTNYVQIGITRAVITLMFVLAMAFGIAMAIEICGIDNFVKNLSMIPHHTYLEFSIAAAISAVGFATIYNFPKRLLPVLAIGGIIAVCTRNFVNLGPSTDNIGLDMGLITGSFVGSALISIICTQAMHWFHMPHHCLSIPCVIPMIPGVLMYRSLFAFIDMHGVVGEVTVAMHNGIRATLIILFIAIGLAIPNIFVRRMVTPKRNKKLLDMVIERQRKHDAATELKEA
uniref:Threonine/serine exporter family protein n=1 Tax=Prevotella sp. GTC17253 TaxID=3236793 RepID=A0AB33INA6_9BACT